MESNYDSETEFATVAVPPSDKRDIPSARGYPYVKHGSGITLLLSGHKAGTSLPVYQSGSLMSGMVVVSKPASIASLEVKVRDLQLPSLLCYFRAMADSPIRDSWKASPQFGKSKEAAGAASSFTRSN
jgi:hypothetical protein